MPQQPPENAKPSQDTPSSPEEAAEALFYSVLMPDASLEKELEAIARFIRERDRIVRAEERERAFQAGVEAMRELAGYVATHACLVPPDGGSPTEEEREMCAEAARQIYAAKLSGEHRTKERPSE